MEFWIIVKRANTQVITFEMDVRISQTKRIYTKKTTQTFRYLDSAIEQVKGYWED